MGNMTENTNSNVQYLARETMFTLHLIKKKKKMFVLLYVTPDLLNSDFVMLLCCRLIHPKAVFPFFLLHYCLSFCLLFIVF